MTAFLVLADLLQDVSPVMFFERVAV